MSEAQIQVCKDGEALAQFTCRWLVGLVQEHQSASEEPFSLCLAGGSTPKRLYQLLSELPEGTIDWTRVVLVWGDERNVPADDDQSNYRMVRESLLDHVAIPAENILGTPDPGGTASEVAAKYETLLKQKLAGADGSIRLDCVLLGMGDDVHTASLFPGTTALKENERLVVENWVEKFDCWRITLTAPVLNAAKRVAFLIAGSAKEPALNQLWHGPRDTSQFPSQIIAPTDGQLHFMLDQAALGENRPPEDSMLEFVD